MVQKIRSHKQGDFVMSYKALYRKWRPGKFNELIGQEHVTTTLKNSIVNNKVSHAYLFCGPRGTGKTSTAKLLAKGLNCNEGPTESPCEKCENCKAMEENRFFDVVEIDAASNRGIDEIRDIRDQVVYPPSQGSFKVFIIDEVHMLTQEAFNALLKTLEEPPAYIIFVLATTEPHKLPMTILSRCQRFDFNRISIKEIISRMEKVMEEIEIDFEQKALLTIARAAEGGMRDALSLLDQCISYSDSNYLYYEDVLKIIGSVDEDVLYRVVKSTTDSDVNSALFIVKEIVEQGKDINQFFKELMSYYRDILLVNKGSEDEELIKGEYDNLKELAKCFMDYELIAIIDFISEKQKELKWSQNPRLILEMTLFRLINRDKIFSELREEIKFLEERVNKLEKKLSSKVTLDHPEDSQDEISAAKEKENKENTKEHRAEPEEDLLVDNESGEEEQNKKELEHELDLSGIESAWPDILENLKKEKIYAYAYVVEGKPLKFKNGILYIGFSPLHKIHKERAEKKENREAIENVIKRWFPDIKVAFELLSDEDASKKTPDSKGENEVKNNKTSREGEKKREQTLIDNARVEFGEDKVEIFRNK